MAGITMSPQFRESPDTANFQETGWACTKLLDNGRINHQNLLIETDFSTLPDIMSRP